MIEGIIARVILTTALLWAGHKILAWASRHNANSIQPRPRPRIIVIGDEGMTIDQLLDCAWAAVDSGQITRQQYETSVLEILGNMPR